MTTIKAIGKEKLIVKGRPGAFVKDCVRDSIILALKKTKPLSYASTITLTLSNHKLSTHL